MRLLHEQCNDCMGVVEHVRHTAVTLKNDIVFQRDRCEMTFLQKQYRFSASPHGARWNMQWMQSASGAKNIHLEGRTDRTFVPELQQHRIMQNTDFPNDHLAPPPAMPDLHDISVSKQQ